MTINDRYVKNGSVWYNDKLDAIENICEELKARGICSSISETSIVREVMIDELKCYSMYEVKPKGRSGVIKWRLAYTLLVVFQWVLWPVCFANWLRTGNFKLHSESKIGNLINRISENAR